MILQRHPMKKNYLNYLAALMFVTTHCFSNAVQTINDEAELRCGKYNVNPFDVSAFSVHTETINTILSNKATVSEIEATDSERKTIIQAVMGTAITHRKKGEYSLASHGLVDGQKFFRHFEILRLTEALSYTFIDQIMTVGKTRIDDIIYDDLFTYSGIKKDVFSKWLIEWFDEVLGLHKDGFIASNKTLVICVAGPNDESAKALAQSCVEQLSGKFEFSPTYELATFDANVDDGFTTLMASINSLKIQGTHATAVKELMLKELYINPEGFVRVNRFGKDKSKEKTLSLAKIADKSYPGMWEKQTDAIAKLNNAISRPLIEEIRSKLIGEIRKKIGRHPFSQVVVMGSGFPPSLVAAALSKNAPSPLAALIVDNAPCVWLNDAPLPSHVLNVLADDSFYQKWYWTYFEAIAKGKANHRTMLKRCTQADFEKGILGVM